MRTAHDAVLDDLAALVAGDQDAIARHAEHLASCDECRDARHDATHLARQLGDAGADYVPQGDLVERLMAKVDAEPTATPAPVTAPAKAKAPAPAPAVTPIATARKRKLVIAIGAATAIAAGAAGIYMLRGDNSGAPTSGVAGDGPIGKVATVSRAAADKGVGVEVKTASGWQPLRVANMLPAGAELRTDERTRTAIDLADGTRIVLDHKSAVVFDAKEPRRIKLLAGRIAADVAHVEKRPASVTTPNARVDVVGTRFSVTTSDAVTAVQVVRGEVTLSGAGKQDAVRAGEEGIVENGTIKVSAAPQLVKEAQWSELAQPTKQDDALAGLGALRAYKPGEKRDRDWKLALAKHDVKVRISGPIARTEITETFRNDSDTTLEGVYQFPLPADAQIDSLSLDMEKEPGGFIDGAFVDKERAAKIWRGVIDKAAPKLRRDPLQQEEIVWVPGPWRDPALLDWKRGGRFELRIYPIPAKGARTIKLAYTQVVTPRGPARQYVYPLSHSSDGSTVADRMTVDVEVRGARQGSVRAAGYELKPDQARGDVNAMTLDQGGFVPRGDLVVEYKPDSAAELRAWTFTGGAAVGPDEKLAAKKKVGIDPKVVEAQRAVASDARPTAVLALAPNLPRWRESKPRDYMIVVDGSQSMVGERFARASELATALVSDLDRRDRFNVLVCDSDCRRFADFRAPSRSAAGELKSWLATQQPAGASDLVAALRAAHAELKDANRERWVLYVGDGFASTGFRRVADVERALAETTTASNVHITTVGIGSDADSALLAAAARGGGGSYVAWTPAMSVNTAALAALESTNGTALRDATVELPAGLSEVAAAGGDATHLPTLRAGSEVLIAARLTGDVAGEIVLRGKVAGEKFEQRYPVKLAVSNAAGNGFVPRLWASLAIDQLERQGKGEDRARIVALSQSYGVMSRETSLLVLESQAMFDAFGVDRSQPTAKWTGEEDIDEVSVEGTIQVATAAKPGKMPMPGATSSGSIMMDDDSGGGGGGVASADEVSKKHKEDKKAPAKAMEPPRDIPPIGRGRTMIPMRRVWERHAALGNYDGVNAAIAKSIESANEALVKNPDSREKHRALVQALSYAGELDKAREVANRWLERDKLDPQALGYIADLLGRDGKRELALRTLAGLVDLAPDRASLHERMVNAYERSGRVAQACSHRIALVSLDTKQAPKRAGAAARCLRTLGRTSDADLVMSSLVDDKARTEAEKLATVATVDSRVSGDLVIGGTWDHATDLDISLIAPDGTRVSWMGGRNDVTVADSTATNREQLSVKRLKKGNYLIEITRSEQTSTPVRGTLDISVLGVKKAIPFELVGERATVGKIAVTMVSHLEPLRPNDMRFPRGGGWD